MDDISVDVSEAEVSTAVTIGELFVIEAELVEHGRVEVVHMDFVSHGLKTEVIGRAVNVSSFDAATCHPGGETIVIVVAPIDLAGIRSLLWHFVDRSSAKFSSPEDESFVEHSTLFQIN